MKTSVKILLVLLMPACFIGKNLRAQNIFPATSSAGIGTTSPNASAALEIKSTTKGLLVSRMTKTQRDVIVSPATGLMIYQTNSTPDFYYYNGSAWTPVSTNGVNKSLSNLIAPTAVNKSLIPGTTNTLNLGSTANLWKNAYFSGDALINGLTIGLGKGGINSNTALGYQALNANTTGTDNTAVGYQALQLNTSGSFNEATGVFALRSNINGARNNAYGNSALTVNTSGTGNNAYGFYSLYANTTGSYNAAYGYQSLYSNSTGNENSAFGTNALYSNTTGYSNVAIGVNALFTNQTGTNSVAVGDSALFNQNGGGGANTAIGSKALFANTTGNSNSAFGYKSLFSNKTGIANMAVGAYALYSNTSDYNVANGFKALYSNTSGYANTATGFQTLLNNTGGILNTGTGSEALFSNTTGSYNTAHGYQALYSNTTGVDNTAMGLDAMHFNTTGSYNTATGRDALRNSTTGNSNTANGHKALYANTTGYYNTAYGSSCLYANTTGFVNTANGYQALYFNTTGNSNTANGAQALYNNISGYANTASGSSALTNNTIGVYNTATGYQALFSSTGNYNTAHGSDALTYNTTGMHNTANGYAALNSNTTGSSNTALGSYADVLTGNLTNATAIGYNTKVETSNSIILGDSAQDTKVSIGSKNASIYKLKIKQTANGYGLNIENGITGNDWEFFSTSLSSEDLFLYNNNSLMGGFDGTSGSYSALSDERLKTDIKNLPSLLTKINQLKPVTYQFKNATAEHKKSIGFIAQDVNKIFPELVTHVEEKERGVEQYLMDYSSFGVIAIKGIQELQQLAKEKDETIDALKNRVEKLEVIMQTLQQNFEKCNPCGVQSAISNQASESQQQKTVNLRSETGSLQQNIPNPFSNNTVIRYYVPMNANKAQLVINDASGTVLKTIALSAKGNGQTTITAGTLSQGNYFYFLMIDGKKSTTKQMIIAR